MKLSRAAFGITFCAGVLLLSAASIEARVRNNDSTSLAIDRVIAPALLSLDVASPAAEDGKPMPDLYTAFGKNVSPPIAWGEAPPGTVSYVVIMQDADAPGGPATHWLIYNIPGTEKGLRRNVRDRAEIKPGKSKDAGMMQGVNYAGGVGYIGPHPPAGDKPHHYHFQVFALDRLIKVKPNSTLVQVLGGMEGRVLAEGEAVGVYAAPKTAETAKPGDQ